MFSCLGDEFSLLIDQTLTKVLLAIEIPANTSWCLKYNARVFLRDQEVPRFQIYNNYESSMIITIAS